MKPKTKFEKGIVNASINLPSLTSKQLQWGVDNSIQYLARFYKSKYICTKCGHQWHFNAKRNYIKCPHCGAKLLVEESLKRTFNQTAYFTVLTACEGYQVVRSVIVRCTMKVGNPAVYDWAEVMQRWVAPDGKYATFARLRQASTMFFDLWLFRTELILRQWCHVYDKIYSGTVCPYMSIIPELKKRGLKRSFYRHISFDLIIGLLCNSKIETLLKMNQKTLLQKFLLGRCNIDEYWPSIRICFRNNYIVHDANVWCDYIDMLKYLGKDTRNAKYVCPMDLKKEHDKAVQKKIKKEVEEEINSPDFLLKELRYKESKSKFFGLVFTDGLITIKMIESVKDMILEGKVMHHCVGHYYTKEDSLIFSASINGKRIETIDVSISQMKVLQCKGVCNKMTQYHNRIIQLVERNISAEFNLQMQQNSD